MQPHTPDPAGDRALVDAYCRTRSEEAFTALFNAHAPAMNALAHHLLGTVDGADDVLQEAWMRAARRIAEFRWQSSLRTWLCGFVVNCCRERFRVPLWEPLPDESVAASSTAAVDVARALARLPPGYRSVVILHDVEGYTHQEIARLLGIDAGTSKSQLSRARVGLRRLLGGPIEGQQR